MTLWEEWEVDGCLSLPPLKTKTRTRSAGKIPMMPPRSLLDGLTRLTKKTVERPWIWTVKTTRLAEAEAVVVQEPRPSWAQPLRTSSGR